MHMLKTLAVLGVGVLIVGCSEGPSPVRPTGVDSVTAVTRVTPTVNNGALAAPAPQMPFKGRISGAWTVAFDPPPSPFFTVVLDGTGNATQLGKFVVHSSHRVNTADGTAAGSYEFTSANGDMVFGDFTGSSRPTDSPTMFAITESVTITGGTGRFVGASGQVVIERVVDYTTSTTTGTFDGVIGLAPGNSTFTAR